MTQKRLNQSEISLFFGDDDAKQLVLKSFWCDHEIQQKHFGGDFWQIMWISQFRRYVEAKIGIVLDDILSETYHVRSTCIRNSRRVRLTAG